MAGVEGDVARPQLRQQFTSFQILCIVLSGLIGTGVFVTNADALQLAGPGGLLLCLCLLSIITIGVSETVSHLVQLFPAPNAIFEYVSTFVDRELAWVVGLAYWYAWTSVFATEMLTAATIIRYWKASPFLTSIISYVVIPIILVFINTRHVQVFGWIEAIGGVLKVFLMTTLTIAIYHAADSNNDGGNQGPINVGIAPNQQYTDHVGVAICVALPLVAWSFGGIESTTMAAFETRPLRRQGLVGEHQQPNYNAQSPSRSWGHLSSPANPLHRAWNRNTGFNQHRGDRDLKSLKDIAWASNSVHWIAVLLYLLYSLAIALTVPWDYLSAPWIFSLEGPIIHFGNSTCGDTSMAVFVPFCNHTASPIDDTQYSPNFYLPGFADFINACLLYSVVSCGNTALYMASRTLYGLASSKEGEAGGNEFVRGIMQTIGSVDPRSGVPVYAVGLSYLIFCWIPWLGFKDNEEWVGMEDVLAFLFVSSSMAYIVVWTALCLAFIRFWYWARKCADGLDHDHRRFCEAKFRYHYREHVHYIVPQPLAAVVGLVGCILLIIASSSIWWNIRAPVSLAWQVGVYFMEAAMLFFWIVMKTVSGWTRLYVHLDNNPSVLQERLDDLVRVALEGVRREGDHHMASLENASTVNEQERDRSLPSLPIFETPGEINSSTSHFSVSVSRRN